MIHKLNIARIIVCFTIGLFLIILLYISCEKEDNKSILDGTWDFNLNCNKVLYRACWGPSHYNYKDIIIFNDGVMTYMWDDSVIYSEKYYIDRDYIIIGTNDNKLAKEFDLKGDTLTLIDTCTTCDINTYIRR
jgi:hypothetical protein